MENLTFDQKFKEELLNVYSLYLMELLKDRKVAVDNNLPSLSQKLEALKASGLSETENYKLLKSQLNSFSELNSKLEVYEFIKDLKSSIPELIVIPWVPFINILNKYNLRAAPLSSYKKVIPNENINNIISYDPILKDSKQRYKCFDIKTKLINSVSSIINDNFLSESIEELRKTLRYPFIENTLIDFPDKVRRLENYVGQIEVNVIDKSDDWIIVAPEEDLDYRPTINIMTKSQHEELILEEERRKRMLQDPLIIKPYLHGVVIITKWDKEGDIEELNNWKL